MLRGEPSGEPTGELSRDPATDICDPTEEALESEFFGVASRDPTGELSREPTGEPSGVSTPQAHLKFKSVRWRSVCPPAADADAGAERVDHGWTCRWHEDAGTGVYRASELVSACAGPSGSSGSSGTYDPEYVSVLFPWPDGTGGATPLSGLCISLAIANTMFDAIVALRGGGLFSPMQHPQQQINVVARMQPARIPSSNWMLSPAMSSSVLSLELRPMTVGDSVGEAVGDVVGNVVGEAVGNAVVGAAVGPLVAGLSVGLAVGLNVVGEEVGDLVGSEVVGEVVGSEVVGDSVGERVGDAVGPAVGAAVGANVVGAAVGIPMSPLRLRQDPSSGAPLPVGVLGQ